MLIPAIIGTVAIIGTASSCADLANNTSGDGSAAQSATATPDAGPGGYGYPNTNCNGACVNYDGMTLTAVNQHRDAAMEGVAPDAGAHWIIADIVVINNPGANEDQVFNAHDFTLVGSDGALVTTMHVYHSYYGVPTSDINGCYDWNVTLARSGGTTGVRQLCFQARGDLHGAMTLRWDPRVTGQVVSVPLAAG